MGGGGGLQWVSACMLMTLTCRARAVGSNSQSVSNLP